MARHCLKLSPFEIVAMRTSRGRNAYDVAASPVGRIEPTISG